MTRQEWMMPGSPSESSGAEMGDSDVINSFTLHLTSLPQSSILTDYLQIFIHIIETIHTKRYYELSICLDNYFNQIYYAFSIKGTVSRDFTNYLKVYDVECVFFYVPF